MFKLILLVLAISCCALGVPHLTGSIPNKPPKDPPPQDYVDYFRSVQDVSNDAPKNKNILSTPVGLINTLKSKIKHVQQLGVGIIQKVADTLKSIEVKGKCVFVVESIFKLIKTALKLMLKFSQVEQLEDSSNTTEESKTRHIREATDEPSVASQRSNSTNALVDFNATLVIFEGIFKLYKDINVHKQKLLKSSLSLVQDFLPGLEIQITEIVGLIEIYLENIAGQAGYKLEAAITNKDTDGRRKRDLTYNNLADFPVDHPEVEDKIRAKRSVFEKVKKTITSIKELTEDLFSNISDKLIYKIKSEEEELDDYFD